MRGVCNVCGCTDNDCSQCIEASGQPCYWVNFEHNFCNRCLADLVNKMNAEMQSNPKTEYKLSEFKCLENINPNIIHFVLNEFKSFRLRLNFNAQEKGSSTFVKLKDLIERFEANCSNNLENNFELDEDEPILDEICPNCKREYDAIDIDYQICHHCNFNNNKD